MNNNYELNKLTIKECLSRYPWSREIYLSFILLSSFTDWGLSAPGLQISSLKNTRTIHLTGLARLEDAPLQMAEWLQTCHDAGIDIRTQINESTALEQGTPPLKGAEFSGGQASSTTVTRYQHLLRALRQYDVKGLPATNPEQLKTVNPGCHNRQQPLQECFLALAKTVEGTPGALSTDLYEEDTGQLLT